MTRPYQIAYTISGAILLASLFAPCASGQVSCQYRLEQVQVPHLSWVNDFTNDSVVVGHSGYQPGDSGVLYDHDGLLLGIPRTEWTLDDLVAVPAGFKRSSILDINSAGQMVVVLTRDDGTRESILVDLFDSQDALAPTWRYLAVPPASSSAYVKRLNDSGLSLGYFRDDTDDEYAFLLDTTNPGAMPEVITDPVSGQPIPIQSSDSLHLNSLGQVSGNTYVETDFGYGLSVGGFRLTPGHELLITPLASGSATSTTIRDMNDFGVLAGEARVTAVSSKRKGKTTSSWRGIRFDESGYDFLPPPTDVICFQINNANDVLGQLGQTTEVRRPQFLFHDSNLLYLDNLVTGAQDDLDFWMAATHFFHQKMNDRDGTEFGQIFIRAETVTTTGKGRKQTTTSEIRFYMLTPELLN